MKIFSCNQYKYTIIFFDYRNTFSLFLIRGFILWLFTKPGHYRSFYSASAFSSYILICFFGFRSQSIIYQYRWLIVYMITERLRSVYRRKRIILFFFPSASTFLFTTQYNEKIYDLYMSISSSILAKAKFR